MASTITPFQAAVQVAADHPHFEEEMQRLVFDCTGYRISRGEANTIWIMAAADMFSVIAEQSTFSDFEEQPDRFRVRSTSEVRRIGLDDPAFSEMEYDTTIDPFQADGGAAAFGRSARPPRQANYLFEEMEEDEWNPPY